MESLGDGNTVPIPLSEKSDNPPDPVVTSTHLIETHYPSFNNSKRVGFGGVLKYNSHLIPAHIPKAKPNLNSISATLRNDGVKVADPEEDLKSKGSFVNENQEDSKEVKKEAGNNLPPLVYLKRKKFSPSLQERKRLKIVTN